MNNIPNGLFEKDLTFLFGTANMNQAHEKLAEMGKSGIDDYTLLDKLSNGRGTEAYQKLSQHRIQSSEYYSAFNFFNKAKTLNLTTPEGMAMHINRNKNQYKKAPKDLKTMIEFVDKGYYIFEGYSPCHNIPSVKQNTKEFRMQTLQNMVYLVRHGLSAKMNKFSSVGNISFRGTPETSFEGCQFVYNCKTGKLVTDDLNKGTFDYGKFGTAAHFFYDISPWVILGNGGVEETPDIFIMDPIVEKNYLGEKSVIVEKIENTNVYLESAFSTLCKFLKDSVKTGFGSKKSIDPLMGHIDGNDYLESQIQKVNANRNEYIRDFIDKNLYRLVKALSGFWTCTTEFVDFVSSGKIIEGLDMFVKDIITDPSDLESLKSEEFATKLLKDVMYNDLVNIQPDDLKEGYETDINLPISIKFETADSWREALQKIPVEGAANEFNRIKDFITEHVNKQLKCVKLRVVTDNVDNTFETIEFSVSQKHSITKEEAIICNKQNVTKDITEDNKEDYVVDGQLPIEATEMLNIYRTPEYNLFR